MRDANRQKMYRAEQSVRTAMKQGARDGNSQGDVVFASIDEATTFLETARETLAAVDPEPTREIVVQEITRGTHSWHKREGNMTRIKLRRGWGMTGVVLLHEFTHHCIVGAAWHRLADVPDHGGEFCRTLLDNVEQVYNDLGMDDMRAKLRAAFDTQRMIYEPATQREAARKQILRLRSDARAAWGDKVPAVPLTTMTYAEDASDFSGATYRTERYLQLDVDSTYTSTLHDMAHDLGEDGDVDVAQLRYVEAPMVRWR